MDYKKLADYRNEHNHFCHLLGMRITKISEGYACGEMDVTSDHLNPISYVHGGCQYTLADAIGGAAASSYGFHIATVDSSFHYLAPGINTTKLLVETREIKHGQTLSAYDICVRNQENVLLSEGIFTYMHLKKEITFPQR